MKKAPATHPTVERVVGDFEVMIKAKTVTNFIVGGLYMGQFRQIAQRGETQGSKPWAVLIFELVEAGRAVLESLSNKRT